MGFLSDAWAKGRAMGARRLPFGQRTARTAPTRRRVFSRIIAT